MRPESRPLAMALLAHIDAVADTLDGGVLSPPEVRRLPGESVDTMFRQLTADRGTVIEHWPADDHPNLSDVTCPIDGQRRPCAAIEQLCDRYGIALGESDDLTQVARSAWSPSDQQVVHIIRRIVAEDS
jgi:hypothetical protein